MYNNTVSKQNVFRRGMSLLLSMAVVMGNGMMYSPKEVSAAEEITRVDYPNNWGRSDIRAYLNNGLGTVASNGTVSDKAFKTDSTKESTNASGYAKNFSDAEYARIEPVEMETNVLNSSSGAVYTYTTKDRLFLPSGNRYSDSYRKVISWGKKDISANSTWSSETKSNLDRIIPISYWGFSNSTNYCWLRSPCYYNTFGSLGSNRGSAVSYSYVNSSYAVAAALKINLKSVIFSSAASAAKIAAEGGATGAKKLTIAGSEKFGVVDTEKSIPDYGMYLKTEDTANKEFNVSKVNLTDTNLKIEYTGGVADKYVTALAYKDDSLTDGAESLAATGKITDADGSVTIDVTSWDVTDLTGYTVQIWMEDGSVASLGSATSPVIYEGSTGDLAKKSTATHTNKRVFATKNELQCSWGKLSSATSLVGSNPTNQKIYYGGKQFWIAGRETAANNGKISASGDIMCLYQAKSDQTTKFNASSSNYSDTKWLAASEFNVTMPENLTYDGHTKEVKVEEKDGLTGVGKINVKYYKSGNLLSGLPKDAGTYTVKIDVADDANYGNVVDLTDSSWTFTIQKATPTASDFTYKTPSSLRYDGTAKKATVTKDNNEIGNITVNYYDSEGNKLSKEPKDAGIYTVKIDVAPSTNYSAVNELSNNWTFEIVKAPPTYPGTPKSATVTYGTKLSEITLEKGWKWTDDILIPSVGTKYYEIYLKVDDVNYDWTTVDGYDPQTHSVKKLIELTAVVDKSTWGEEVENNGVINYVVPDGTTSAEVTENGMIWLKEKSNDTSAWYGIDNSEGIFEIGSRFWVKWLSKEQDSEEWQKHYDALDEEYKKAVDSGKIWIFLTGVTSPDGVEYTDFTKDLPYYIELGQDWDKEDIKAVFVNSGSDEIVDVSYINDANYPGKNKELAVLTLKHFSPYAVYDNLTDEERVALEKINNKKVTDYLETGDGKTALILEAFLALSVVSGTSVLALKKKREE